MFDPKHLRRPLLKLSPIALAASTLAWAAPATAQGVDELGAYGGREDVHFESPQYGAVEVRFGRYVPNVDDEFNGAATPYADTFGDDSRYLIGLEFDWQLLRIPHFGSLGPGIGWGYTKSTAKAPLTSTGERSEQETSLTIMPMYLVGVLRVDVLAKDLDIPLVPYGKAGLGYALWWSRSGDESARDDNGTIGRDTSYGWQFALGGMLLLDSLDERSAIEMDENSGVNNSYFFLEWYVSNLDGFGGGKMNVGDNTWMLGLALEF
ncbi:MAG: hypothetical protein H6718_27765 [Polyangiaceae bacterium]|nr:hypothetical protein [Polyangiaceae bacterium]